MRKNIILSTLLFVAVLFVCVAEALAISPSLAAGVKFSLVVKSDGTLWAWGRNDDGQLGDGTTEDRNRPVLIGSGYTMVAAGAAHSIALKSDGSVWAWGHNYYGQVGDGSNEDRNEPVCVGSGFISVAAGGGTSYALKSNGALWAWGYNGSHQFGDGGTVNRNYPAKIASGVKSFAAGGKHVLAIKQDGSVWGWGSNSWGCATTGYQGGTGDPVEIPWKLDPIWAGSATSFGLNFAGRLLAWGWNSGGALGNGTTISTTDVVYVGTGYVDVCSYNQHTIALKDDKSLWVWGINLTGETKTRPVKIGEGFTCIATGLYHALAINEDGRVYGIGDNSNGCLGVGDVDWTSTHELVPIDDFTVIAESAPINLGPMLSLVLSEEESKWEWEDPVDVSRTFGLLASSANISSEDGYTFRPETLALINISIDNPRTPSSHYLSKNDVLVGSFRKTKIGMEWVNYWGDFVEDQFMGALLGAASSYFDQVVPSVLSSAVYGFSIYIEPQATYKLGFTGQTLCQYTMDYIVDRDSDIFADNTMDAYVVNLDYGGRFRVDGKLNYLTDRNDFIAFKPSFSGQVPMVFSQFKQSTEVRILRAESNGDISEIEAFTGDDMDIIKKRVIVKKNCLYLIQFHNPAIVDISTATYTVEFIDF